MAEYHFHPTLLLRSPVYSYHLYSEKNLRAIIKQPFFQKAIYFSSEVFYDELKKSDFDWEKLSKKAIETLNKYFNRMCYRPTPFGLCAAFGTVLWGSGPVIKFAEGDLKPHIQFSYLKNIEYAHMLDLDHDAEKHVYKLNSTIYKTGNEYRFLKSSRDNAQIEFVIDSLKTDRFFEKTLQYLSHWHTRNEIRVFVRLQASCTHAEADTYVQWLVNNQVISQQLEANITGDDYLQRLLNINTISAGYKHIKSVFNQNAAVLTIDDLQYIPGRADDLKSDDFYLNLEAKFPEGTLNTLYQQDITDALKCLDSLSLDQQAGGLSDFTKKFAQKFGGQIIPLLIALDPEIGVGYENLAVEEDDANIIKNIIRSPAPQNRAMQWNNAHTLFFNKWKRATDQNSVITITEDDLKSLKKGNETCAPTISVMFRLLNNKVFIESAGGTCASALIGRFTPFNTDIHQLACDVAAKEAEHNPDIIFAEIAHICHDRTANIDRRRHIYPYEIPVLVQSTMKREQQISLSDLWVSVVDGKVILQSKTHGKRVIPRLSSAFNYTRNDLAVFRFLCDMQRAQIKINFNLNLSQFFPALSFYPRVEYKNAILHLAYWNIKGEVFAPVLNADANSKIDLFTALKIQLGLPDHIALTQHDHQLVFNLGLERDVLFFLDTIKPLQQLTIKEYLLLRGENPVLIDDVKGPHINQFITSLYQTTQVYKPVTTPIVDNRKLNQKFIPGSEWLYLKLYCHPIRSNELLSDCIAGIIKKLNKTGLINAWFFIRYLDPDYHIRLRLKVEPHKHHNILSIVHDAIRNHITNGTVSNYTIAVYEPEIERYSPQFMPQFEHAFYASSNFVLAFLKQQPAQVPAKNVLEFAMVSVNDIVFSLEFEGNTLIRFYELLFNAFANEFNDINDLKYQLDIEFRKQKTVIEMVKKNSIAYYNNLKLNKARAIFIQSLTNLKATINSKVKWKEERAADLIHMHLNRLFINDARKQEMAVYYFLLKYERSAQARSTAK